MLLTGGFLVVAGLASNDWKLGLILTLAGALAMSANVEFTSKTKGDAALNAKRRRPQKSNP